MPDYRIQILIDARDHASGPLRSVGSALGNMGQIAGGIIGAQLFTRMAQGLFDFASGAIQATANMQAMQVGLEGLIAREISHGETIKQLTQQQITLTDQQKLRLMDLEQLYPKLTGQLADLTREYNSQVAATGANSEAALRLHIELNGLQVKVAQTGDQLNYLRDASDGVVNVMREVSVGTMSIGEAMSQAQGKAKDMMKELANIAILSPYQVEAVQNTFRMAMAFGYTSDQAKDFTAAILNVAAGTGATNDMLNRMAYNFAQIRLQGKVTAMDIRQLAMAGFDLNAVLKYTGEQVGVNIQTHEDFNKALAEGKITWEQFNQSFAKYADENFGGAAERMSRTLNGLKSTFKDLLVLTMPQILGPATEMFTDFANEVLNGFLEIRESGILDSLAGTLAAGMGRMLATIKPLVGYFLKFFNALGKGAKVTDAFKMLIYDLAGPVLAEQIFEVVRGVERFALGIHDLWVNLQPLILKVGEFIAQNVRLSDVVIAIGAIIAAAVIPALVSLVAAFAPVIAMIGIVALLRNAWEGNWFGMRDTLTAAWQNSILPALQTLWTWLQVNIPLAIQTVSSYWNTTLLPALQTAWGWIQTNVFPIIQQLWTWLQVNIPLAIQTVANFWTNVLLPASLRFWNWMNTSFFPALQNLWNWLQTNIPLALQTLSNFWTVTLLPAIQSVWGWMNSVLFPFWQSLANFTSAVFGKAIEALAGLWQNILYPALQTVVNYLQTYVFPKFDKIASLVSGSVRPTLEGFSNWLSTTFAKAWKGISEAIQTVTGWIDNLAEKINKLKLPAWLEPGSPTPFELGLRGISRAMSALNTSQLPKFAANLNFGTAGAGMGGTPAPIYVTVQANVSGDVDIDYMAYRVAKKIQEMR